MKRILNLDLRDTALLDLRKESRFWMYLGTPIVGSPVYGSPVYEIRAKSHGQTEIWAISLHNAEITGVWIPSIYSLYDFVQSVKSADMVPVI